jgi:hypothetical protein
MSRSISRSNISWSYGKYFWGFGLCLRQSVNYGCISRNKGLFHRRETSFVGLNFDGRNYCSSIKIHSFILKSRLLVFLVILLCMFIRIDSIESHSEEKLGSRFHFDSLSRRV